MTATPDLSAFIKAYDVRGLVPDQLSPQEWSLLLTSLRTLGTPVRLVTDALQREYDAVSWGLHRYTVNDDLRALTADHRHLSLRLHAPAALDPATVPPAWSLPRGVILLLGTTAGFISLLGVRTYADIVAPLFLAIIIVVAAVCVGPVARLGGDRVTLFFPFLRIFFIFFSPVQYYYYSYYHYIIPPFHTALVSSFPKTGAGYDDEISYYIMYL